MEYKMKLTDEQRAILDGSKGETLAKVMESLVRYGELFGATEMVPISSKYNHLVTSFGLKALGPVYELMDKLLEAGAPSGQKFSVDPKPLDKNLRRTWYSKYSCTAARRITKHSFATSVCCQTTHSPALATWTK